MKGRLLLFGIALLCSLDSNDAFTPISSSALSVGLRIPRRTVHGLTAVQVKASAGEQSVACTRRAALLFTLLPAFASAAQAKGDSTLSFQTEIAGSDGRFISASTCDLNCRRRFLLSWPHASLLLLVSVQATVSLFHSHILPHGSLRRSPVLNLFLWMASFDLVFIAMWQSKFCC